MANLFDFDAFLIFQQIDGQAFMLLNVQTVQQYLHVKLGPAIKLCKIVEKLNLAYLERYMMISVDGENELNESKH